MGTGGNNVPFYVEEYDKCPLTLKIRSGCEGGGKGALNQKDKSATLACNNHQTLFEPKSYGFYPQMKAESQSLQEEKANTIVNGTNPGYQNGLLCLMDQGG